MAGRLLLGILLCSFQEIHVEALPPPQLTANKPEIMETDTVTLNCLPPSNQSASQCYFYTEGPENKIFSCLKTLTGTELLQMAHQSSPAEVKVKCFHTIKYGDGDGDFPSPHSNTFTINIFSNIGRPHAVTPVTPIKVLTVTAGNDKEHFITSSLTTVTPASETVTDNLSTSISVSVAAATKPPVNLTSGDDDVTETVTDNLSTSISVSVAAATKPPVNRTSGDDDVTASKTDMRLLWKLVAVTTGLGVAVGVISLGLALLCTKRRDGEISCGSVLHAATEKPNRREPQDEMSLVYHQYATISDEPCTSAQPKEMVYSTVQLV